MAPKQERDFQEEALIHLRTKVGGVWWANTPSAFDQRGRPDIEGVRLGIFYGFELKKHKNSRRDPLQEEELERINNNGGVGMFLNNLGELKEVFD